MPKETNQALEPTGKMWQQKWPFRTQHCHRSSTETTISLLQQCQTFGLTEEVIIPKKEAKSPPGLNNLISAEGEAQTPLASCPQYLCGNTLGWRSEGCNQMSKLTDF